MKKEEMIAFKENVDGWVRELSAEVSSYKDIPTVVEYNAENNQHNYELIQELKDNVEELRDDLRMMKAIQAAILETSIDKR